MASQRHIMTRHILYLSNKLSRQSPSTESIDFVPPCKIRGLAEFGRLAPVLRERLASLINTLRIDSFQTVPILKSDCWSEHLQQRQSLSEDLPLIGVDHQSSANPHPSFFAAASLGDLSLNRRSRCSSNEARRASAVLIEGSTDTVSAISSSPPQEEGDRLRRVPVTLILFIMVFRSSYC